MEISKFLDIDKIENRNLRQRYFFNELLNIGNSENTTIINAQENGVNMIVVDKTMANMRVAANQVMSFNKDKMDDVITKAKKINELAKGIAAGNKEKSKFIDMHSQLIVIAENFSKKYGNKVNKMSSYYGDIIIVGIILMLVESSAILSEAIIAVTAGTNKSIDEYVKGNKKYTDIFEVSIADILKLGKEVDKISAELYKESLDIGSLHAIESFYLQEGQISLEAESNVSLFRVFKALLFKPLYIILAPIRYIIYMFMLAGFTVVDRMQQIQNTIAVYDSAENQIPVAQREGKIRQLEQTASKARLDRVETDAKVYKKTEDEKENLTKDINGTNNKASLAAIF